MCDEGGRTTTLLHGSRPAVLHGSRPAGGAARVEAGGARTFWWPCDEASSDA
jgi:hypothetical protein